MTNFGSDIGLSPDKRQFIVWISDVFLLDRHLEINMSEILTKLYEWYYNHTTTVLLKTTDLKMRCAK